MSNTYTLRQLSTFLPCLSFLKNTTPCTFKQTSFTSFSHGAD